MNCVFFGYGQTPIDVYDRLKSEILKMVDDNGVKRFLVVNNGRFDAMVQKALKEISVDREIDYSIVLSKIDENAICGEQDKTIYPEGLEYALRRFAITKRNGWLLNNADFLICYYVEYVSRAGKWIEKAKRRGIKTVNLND